MGSLRRKWWAYALVALVLIVLVFASFRESPSQANEVPTSQFIEDVQDGDVTRIDVRGETVDYKVLGDSVSRTTHLEDGDSVRAILFDAGINPGSRAYPDVFVDEGSGLGSLGSLIITFLPVIVIVGVLFFFLRQANKAQQRPPFGILVTNLDPVCRASVNPGSGGSSTFMTTTYHFCSAEHKQQFDADPSRYLLQK